MMKSPVSAGFPVDYTRKSQTSCSTAGHQIWPVVLCLNGPPSKGGSCSTECCREHNLRFSVDCGLYGSTGTQLGLQPASVLRWPADWSRLDACSHNSPLQFTLLYHYFCPVHGSGHEEDTSFFSSCIILSCPVCRSPD